MYVITPHGELVACNSATGSELWRRSRDEPTTWATPLVVEHGGKSQVVMPGTKRLISYDLETGKTVWETEGLTLNAIPTLPFSVGSWAEAISKQAWKAPMRDITTREICAGVRP